MPYQSTVSVVITTRKRPQLLPRAVRSALNQTHPPMEVIIVIDGTDDETIACITTFNDRRIRTIAMQHPVGACNARNIGVDAAEGDWIAFLDDDDEWHPEKLQAQLKVAARSHAEYPVVSCRVIGHTPFGQSFVWPKRRPAVGEHLSDYLLARNTLTQGEGLITTSMILAPRTLLIKTPFTNGLRRHQEWDWLLRVSASAEVEIVIAWDTLATWHIDAKRASISGTDDWRTSFDWITGIRRLVTPRAYASFLLVFIGAISARERDFSAISIILKEARRVGRPARIDYLLGTTMWLLPQKTRRKIRNLFVPTVQTA